MQRPQQPGSNSGGIGVVERLLAEAGRFICDLREAFAFGNELAELDRRGSLKVILDDLGLSLSDIQRMARGYPEAGWRLPEMAAHLKLDLDNLDPRTLYALKQTCALCDAHRHCRRWLATATANAMDYKDFCPNAELLDAAANPALHI